MNGYRIVPLADQDRSTFASGSVQLDQYFRKRVGQDMRRRFANCYVALDPEGDIAGVYTLAAGSISASAIDPKRAKKLPRYPDIPAFLLGRLAVAMAHQGKRLGGALVIDAIQRATAWEVAAHFLIVDAKDETAARFYEHFGFGRLRDGGLRLAKVL
jgi:ribosomal protein S18 acetylase RimI-like enzyme